MHKFHIHISVYTLVHFHSCKYFVYFFHFSLVACRSQHGFVFAHSGVGLISVVRKHIICDRVWMWIVFAAVNSFFYKNLVFWMLFSSVHSIRWATNHIYTLLFLIKPCAFQYIHLPAHKMLSVLLFPIFCCCCCHFFHFAVSPRDRINRLFFHSRFAND